MIVVTEILAWIGAFVLVLQAASHVPAAPTDLVHAIGHLLDAVRDRGLFVAGRPSPPRYS